MTKVKIRIKSISKGRHSLYLDYYPPILHPDTGKPTRREFLKLFTYDKPKTEFDRQHNKETKLLAEAIRAQRQLDIQKEDYGFLSDTKKNTDFLQYFKELAAKRKGTNSDNWQSALKYLERFTNGSIRMGKLDRIFCNEFRNHLLTQPSMRSDQRILARNSAISYYNKFKAALKQAYKDGLIETNLSDFCETIKVQETHREYLTYEELQKVAKEECFNPVIKKAALFSALTGLRFSDIQRLTWEQVELIDSDQYQIRFRQHKTGGAEVHPISKDAVNLLGARGDTKAKVFGGLKYSAYNNLHLKQWVMKAGITKDITFHSFRHTYATLQLSLGTDIYTVSKMLGHRELKTTQVYVKIIDKNKREAADRIKLDV